MNEVLCPVCEGYGCQTCSYEGVIPESKKNEILVEVMADDHKYNDIYNIKERI